VVSIYNFQLAIIHLHWLTNALCSGTLAIEEGISYEAAKNSNEFELAKIAMIILIHGVNEHEEFVAAADKLDENHYSMITTFYNLCSRDKIKIPPKEVRIYDEFLNSTSNSRRSISKG